MTQHRFYSMTKQSLKYTPEYFALKFKGKSKLRKAELIEKLIEFENEQKNQEKINNLPLLDKVKENGIVDIINDYKESMEEYELEGWKDDFFNDIQKRLVKKFKLTPYKNKPEHYFSNKLNMDFTLFCGDITIESYAPNLKKTPKRVVDGTKKVIVSTINDYKKYNKEISYECYIGDLKTHVYEIILS
jgi:hypothetical protein